MNGRLVTVWPRKTDEERFLEEIIARITDDHVRALRSQVEPYQRRLTAIHAAKAPMVVFVPDGSHVQ